MMTNSYEVYFLYQTLQLRAPLEKMAADKNGKVVPKGLRHIDSQYKRFFLW